MTKMHNYDLNTSELNNKVFGSICFTAPIELLKRKVYEMIMRHSDGFRPRVQWDVTADEVKATVYDEYGTLACWISKTLGGRVQFDFGTDEFNKFSCELVDAI